MALTIAGSDNSGGAGIQADLKTFSALRVYGLSAVTAVVAEIPAKVSRIQGIPPDMVEEQISLLFEAFPIAAVKTGMLHSTKTIQRVAAYLKRQRRRQSFKLVVDPVMVASSGDPLLEKTAIQAYLNDLLPLADLVTPNLDEAGVLLGGKPSSSSELPVAGRELARRFGAAFLMKGGHLESAMATDWLVEPEGSPRVYRARFRRGIETHGSGCTYSSAITAALALGHPLPQAVAIGKKFITRAIETCLEWPETGVQALNHLQRPNVARVTNKQG